ncbi:hypothetical protein ACF1AE_22745 [Streptomyces sp. NPDC014986]|uniref:hypothetical protein n=1 Tax=Streptomyces sp. NPDC014986 TaxID=3364934 RepID=UPI0036FAA31F
MLPEHPFRARSVTSRLAVPPAKIAAMALVVRDGKPVEDGRFECLRQFAPAGEPLLGSGACSVAMMLLGNPLSGLATGPYRLPDGGSTFGRLPPPGAPAHGAPPLEGAGWGIGT